MVSSGGVVSEGGKGSSSSGGGDMNGNMKKGPWTAAEDSILMEYVKKHGEGNWNAVQKNSGLMRCGKSCRLRWANHLRPNLKKGSFSPEEEKLIIELHAKLGNKWARMAAQLPGRTDNEIKNYWNTRMKRRQRAGLPIYPQEIKQKATAYHLQQHPHKRPNTTNNNSSSLSSLLTSQNHQTYNPSLSLFNAYNFNSPQTHILQNQSNPFYTTTNNPNHQFKLFYPNNTTTTTIPSSSFFFNHNTQPLSFPTMKVNHGLDFDFSSMVAGDPNVFGSDNRDSELPSTQTTPSSDSSGGVGVGNNSNHNLSSNVSNSGLLDALVQESHNLSRNDVNFNGGVNDSDTNLEEKGKSVVDYVGGPESTMNNAGGDDLSSSHSQSSIGIKRNREQMEDQAMNSMDEDLISLLNNFPMSMPIPEWYPSRSTNTSNASSSTVTAGSNVESVPQSNMPPTPPPPPPQPTVSSPENQLPQLSSCSSWNNMPGIC